MCFLCWCSSVLVGKKINFMKSWNTMTCLSQQKYACHDKSFIATNVFFICDKTFVTTSILLWQKTCFVTTKMILEAAPANDNLYEWTIKKRYTLHQWRANRSWLMMYLLLLPHVGLVYDVDYAECWAQNDSNQNTRNWKTAICFCYSVE